MQIQNIVAFIAVVETSSFTYAAQRLSTAKSVISRRLGDLEGHLGVTLIDRSKRQIATTEIGAVFYAKCVRIMEAVEAAEHFASNFSSSVRGKLRVGIPSALVEAELGRKLLRFAKQHPDLLLEVVSCTASDDTSAQRLDVVVHTGPAEQLSHIVKTIGQVRYLLCAAPEYLARHTIPATLEDLKAHDFLVESHLESDGYCLLGSGRGERAVQVRVRLRGSEPQQLTTAAEEGMGIAWLPEPAAMPRINAGGLVAVLPESAARTLPLTLAYPESRRGMKSVKTLVEFLGGNDAASSSHAVRSV